MVAAGLMDAAMGRVGLLGPPLQDSTRTPTNVSSTATSAMIAALTTSTNPLSTSMATSTKQAVEEGNTSITAPENIIWLPVEWAHLLVACILLLSFIVAFYAVADLHGSCDQDRSSCSSSAASAGPEDQFIEDEEAVDVEPLLTGKTGRAQEDKAMISGEIIRDPVYSFRGTKELMSSSDIVISGPGKTESTDALNRTSPKATLIAASKIDMRASRYKKLQMLKSKGVKAPSLSRVVHENWFINTV
ncbi:unnamed protein product [Amoebophrya sp. A120]|nr:unnamed protein product [Amoebophrya sp. A120]|eukprot:GSA120T00005629001.1